MTGEAVRTQVIGAAGELLVQYKLLKHGVDSARLTTDDGIDLVVYSPRSRRAATVQVKSNWGPRPAGGRGAPTLGWTFPHGCPADWLACVDLSRDKAWLFTTDDARELAQQHHPGGKRLLYWYLDDAAVGGGPRREADMRAFEMDDVVQRLPR